MLHKNIRVQESSNGKSLFVVNEKIKAGEITFTYFPELASPYHKTLKVEEARNLPEDQKEFFFRYCYSDGDGYLSGPVDQQGLEDDATFYLNHSCDPNSWVLSPTTAFAYRDIEVGEEVTTDYDCIAAPKPPDVAELLDYDTEECHCGSANCRGVFGAAAYRDPAFRKKYSIHMQPEIMKLIIEEFPEEKDIYIAKLKEFCIDS